MRPKMLIKDGVRIELIKVRKNLEKYSDCTGVCTPNEHTFLNCPSRGTGSWIFSNSFFNCFLIMKLRPREKILHIQLC